MTLSSRSVLRAVAVPSEHGGWGLTLEPVLLGLLVAPSRAGLLLGVAAFVAFLARTPLRVVLVDRHRHRVLPRTRVAARVLGVELVLLAALVVAADRVAPLGWWWPALVAAPLVALELWFDLRSRSRRLVPELAGAVGIAGVVALVTVAGGSDARLAGGLWLVLAARSVTAIPTVRDQVGRLHGRPGAPRTLVVADAVAIAVATAAAILSPAVRAGTLGVVGLVVAQRLLERRPTDRAVVIGVRQTLLGLALVAVTAIGVASA